MATKLEEASSMMAITKWTLFSSCSRSQLSSYSLLGRKNGWLSFKMLCRGQESYLTPKTRKKKLSFDFVKYLPSLVSQDIPSNFCHNSTLCISWTLTYGINDRLECLYINTFRSCFMCFCRSQSVIFSLQRVPNISWDRIIVGDFGLKYTKRIVANSFYQPSLGPVHKSLFAQITFHYVRRGFSALPPLKWTESGTISGGTIFFQRVLTFPNGPYIIWFLACWLCLCSGTKGVNVLVEHRCLVGIGHQECCGHLPARVAIFALQIFFHRGLFGLKSWSIEPASSHRSLVLRTSSLMVLVSPVSNYWPRVCESGVKGLWSGGCMKRWFCVVRTRILEDYGIAHLNGI